MDNNERDLLIRCLANCDDVDKLLDAGNSIDNNLRCYQIRKCNDKVKELLSSIVIFDNRGEPTVYH